ncbi:prepilin-type N-terminal cleavage/methylation domain-containing protein [bacterium]|nr:prepilin-type N-terminal cleavage/methylation domain-containing protein [bacterium]
MKRRHGIRHCKGMTLIEVVIVIAIIATLAAVAVPSIISTLDLNDRQTTEKKMDSLAEALNNYYEDVGEYPSRTDLSSDALAYVQEKGYDSSLEFLINNPYPLQSTEMKDTIRHDRWNGPYLTASFNPDDYKKDAWGRKIYYCPVYGRSREEYGVAFAGAELPSNSVLLASMGKTPGWGYRRAGDSSAGGPTGGMTTWEELIKFIPYGELFGGDYDHLLKENVMKVISPATMDREKAKETEEKYEEIKNAICGMPIQDIEGTGCVAGLAADLGLSLPSGGADEIRPVVALSTEIFRDLENPMQLLVKRFNDSSAKELYYGSPRDVAPPYRMGDADSFNVRKSELDYAWMGWRGPYIADPGETYTNNNSPDVITYGCFIDGWGQPIAAYEDSGGFADYDAILDLNFGNRTDDEDYYDQLGGLLASPGPNRMFDRVTSGLLDPNLVRPGGGMSSMLGNDSDQDDDDVFVELYKRDLFANIAPHSVVEAYSNGSDPVNTPVEIVLEYQTGKLPSPALDRIYGIAVIYPDPSQAAGFNVVELMDSSNPFYMASSPDYIYKTSFTAIEKNLFIPVGYVFIYVMVSHHQNVGTQPVGYCKALTQRLSGWKETDWNGITITKIYGKRVCVRNGISTISVAFTLLGGG